MESRLFYGIHIVVMAALIGGTVWSTAQADSRRMPDNLVKPTQSAQHATGLPTGKRQHKPFTVIKANPAAARAEMTPWEKFCWNNHKDDFMPDGYANCVAGLPD